MDASPQNEWARLGTGRLMGVPSEDGDAQGGLRYCGDVRPVAEAPMEEPMESEPGVMGDGYGAGRFAFWPRLGSAEDEGEGERDRELGADRRVGVR